MGNEHAYCHTNKVYQDLKAERDRLKAELDAMKTLAIYHDARAVRFRGEADLWKSRAAKLAKALRKIGYAQGDGHPLALMKVAQEALAEYDREV